MLSRAEITFAADVHSLLELSLESKFGLFVNLVNINVACWAIDKDIRLASAYEGVQMMSFVIERNYQVLTVLVIFIDCLLQPLKVEHTCLAGNLGFHHLQLRHRVSLKRGKVVKLLTEHFYRLCSIQYSLVFQDCREAFGQEFFESLLLWLLMLRLS